MGGGTGSQCSRGQGFCLEGWNLLEIEGGDSWMTLRMRFAPLNGVLSKMASVPCIAPRCFSNTWKARLETCGPRCIKRLGQTKQGRPTQLLASHESRSWNYDRSQDVFGVCRTLVRAHACSARHVSWVNRSPGPADVACGQVGGKDHLIPAHTRHT